MALSTNEEIVRRAYLDGMNNRDMAVIEETVAPDYICNFPAAQGDVKGRDAFIETLSAFLSAFDRLEFTVEESFSHDDRVVLRWSAAGRHTGDYAGLTSSRVI